jgi:hypothetical protein
LKEQQALLAQLEKWLKKPRSKIILDLERLKTVVEKDRNFQIQQDEQELVVA